MHHRRPLTERVNGGTHIGSLWTAGGTKLASAVFIAETASGWQQATFSTPVAIAANTTYVASYHAPAGRYAATGGYFSASVDSGPLHVQADGVNGPSGVYAYGAPGTFPNDSWAATNYWVDAIFNTSVAGYTPISVVPVKPVPGATGVSTTTTVAAGIIGSVSYPSVNTTTFELRDPAGLQIALQVDTNCNNWNASSLRVHGAQLSAPAGAFTAVPVPRRIVPPVRPGATTRRSRASIAHGIRLDTSYSFALADSSLVRDS